MSIDKKQKTENLKEQLNKQLQESLISLKDILGSKKYDSRIKKAVKILTEGLDKKKKKMPVEQQVKEPAVALPVKKSTAKKITAAKPEPVKKAAGVKTNPAKAK